MNTQINLSKLNLSKRTFSLLAVSLSISLMAFAEPPTVTLPDIVVTADPLTSKISLLPSSATVISEQTSSDNNATTLSDTLQLVPNINFAGGSNTPRFFQIRGIGELEQYEGAPASSVGLLVDDFDFTGLGSVVQMFDAEQLEVLRGPQGMAFGQNALAGLLHVKLADPTPELSGKGQFGFGTDDFSGGGLSVGGPIAGTDKKIQFHLSGYHEYENGFRHNAFLNTDDTNQRDTFTGIAKLRILPEDKTSIDLSFLRVDMNNGYDAFSIDNRLTTQSDRPGDDRQGSTGASVKVQTALTSNVALTSVTSLTNSKIDYSFDGDWGNNAFWGANAPYDYFSKTKRDREQAYQEFRLSSFDSNYVLGDDYRWLLGLYGQRLQEDSSIRNDQDGVPYDDLESTFHAWTKAVFGQVEVPIQRKLSFTTGARYEVKDAHYEDSRLNDEEPSDEMLGGNASLQYELEKDTLLYGLVSRGYKAGGVNTSIAVPTNKRLFDPEYLWNFETGLKGRFRDIGLTTNVATFYQLRRDQQVKLSVQNDPNDPLSFTYFTDNAARGHNYGGELDAALEATKKLSIESSVSLLQTRFYEHLPSDEVVRRGASHAPSWQYAFGPRYQVTNNLFFKCQSTGKNSFYFDDSFDKRSHPYALVDATIGYEKENWSWTIWAKNIFDKKYEVRGFYFGLEPPDYPSKLYTQQGDPFRLGTTLTFYF